MPGIIKGHGTGEPEGTSRSLFNFEDMTQQARAALSDVRREAELIVIRAQAEAEEIRADAIRQGRDEALRIAREELKQELSRQLASALPSLSAASRSLLEQREAWMAHWERHAVLLAVRIAEKIVRRELASDPAIPIDWIRQTLELIGRQEQVTIELAPQDHASLGSRLDDVASQLGRVAPTRIVPAADLQVGDCRVTTQFGEFDLRLATQLARIEAELT